MSDVERARAADFRTAIAALTRSNRAHRDGDVERALVGLRREGGAAALEEARHPLAGPPVPARGPGGEILEVAGDELSVETIREGFACSGCLLVRGLVNDAEASRLVQGMDAALAAYDASLDGGGSPDPGAYDPRPMPDRSASALPEDAHRAFLRSRGSLWTADSPRVLFDLLDIMDRVGLGRLMTELFGERPLLSALKATLRRMPPDADTDGRWHQDGSFLGQEIAALNIWLALTPCGVDAPGLEIVPRRVEGVLDDPHAKYAWALSDEAVLDAASGTPIAAPTFEPGDALLFDHLLVHRTGVTPGMTRERYAIESWFFPPAAYPDGQLPLMY